MCHFDPRVRTDLEGLPILEGQPGLGGLSSLESQRGPEGLEFLVGLSHR